MKQIRILAPLLALMLVLSAFLSSCENTPDPTTAGTAPAPSETAGFLVEYPVISDRVTLADIQEIPRATSDMGEDKLREICVRYMTLMQSVVWTPDDSFNYICETAQAAVNGKLGMTKGVRYSGMPYSKAAQDLEGFLEYYDSDTGILNVSRLKDAGTLIGNHCSSSCYWAWSRISAALTPTGNSRILPAFGFSLIAPCTLKEEITIMTADRDTRWICDSNGEQTVYEAYANFKPASGMITWKDGSVGHMRMAVAVPTVVRDSSGKIDGDKSTVLVNEQVSVQTKETTADGGAQSIGRVQESFTFRELFRTAYVPFEIPELAGKATVQAPVVTLETGGEGQDAFLEGRVVSNYFISRTEVVFRSADGAVVYENAAQGFGIDTSLAQNASPRVMEMKSVVSSGMLTRNLKKGETYSVTVTARLSHGETLTVYTGEYTRN